MPISVTCPGCSKTRTIPDAPQQRSRRARCPDCGTQFELPAVPQEPELVETDASQVSVDEPDDEPDQRGSIPQPYEYRMVQIPPGISVREDKEKGNEAAAYLERVVNKYALMGWEFYRVDAITVRTYPGCLGMLLGRREDYTTYHVITFRRGL
ncbi:MAG TPA: hypothetical protein VIL46_12675 [Gemmataceae bacterium]